MRRRERSQRSNARHADTEGDFRAAIRRADKAAYLRRKVDEQAAADAESGSTR